MKGILVALSFLFLSACQTAPQSTQLDTKLSSVPDTKLAVVLVELPDAGYYKFGSQGLLDLAINSALGIGIKIDY